MLEKRKRGGHASANTTMQCQTVLRTYSRLGSHFLPALCVFSSSLRRPWPSSLQAPICHTYHARRNNPSISPFQELLTQLRRVIHNAPTTCTGCCRRERRFTDRIIVSLPSSLFRSFVSALKSERSRPLPSLDHDFQRLR